MLAIPYPLNHTRTYPGKVPMWETSTTLVFQWIFIDCSDLWMSISIWGLLNTSMEDTLLRRIQLGLIAPFCRKVCANRTSWYQSLLRLSSPGGLLLSAPNRSASILSLRFFTPSLIVGRLLSLAPRNYAISLSGGHPPYA